MQDFLDLSQKQSHNGQSHGRHDRHAGLQALRGFTRLRVMALETTLTQTAFGMLLYCRVAFPSDSGFSGFSRNFRKIADDLSTRRERARTLSYHHKNTHKDHGNC
jgi:hypothetical protein